MNYRAIVLGALALAAMGMLMLLVSLLAGVERFTGPQLLTVSSLSLLCGLHAGLTAREAGTLHGMLAGLAGGLLMVLEMMALAEFAGKLPLLEQVTSKGYLLYVVLGGFWGAIGGIFSDNVRMVKAKIARRRQRERGD
jgi:hypothetical protein